MNGAWSFWAFVGTLVVQGITAAYVYGRLTERVSNLTKKVDEHADKLDNHGQRISHLEGRRHV